MHNFLKHYFLNLTQKQHANCQISVCVYSIFVHILPSSVLVHQRNVSTAAARPRHPAWVGRGTSAGAQVIFPAGGGHRAPPSSAGRHAVKTAVAGAGPAPANGEPPHESAAASPLLKHHGETAVLVGFVVEVGVVGLRATLDGGLREGRERQRRFVNRAKEKIVPRAKRKAESDSRPQ